MPKSVTVLCLSVNPHVTVGSLDDEIEQTIVQQ